MALSIKHRLLVSHLFAVVVLAGAFGAFVYYVAAQQVAERFRVQLVDRAMVIAASINPTRLDTDPLARAQVVARLQAIAQSSPELARAYVVQNGGADERVLASSEPDTAALAAGQSDLSVRVPLSGPGAYALGMDLRSGVIAENLYTLRLSAALAFLVCVLGALVLSRHLATRFLARITDLAARCRALANGDPLPPRHPRQRDEFDMLINEFDAMALRVRNTSIERERAQAALREANERLEQHVRRRTSELENATSKLRGEIESRVHVEALLAEAALTDSLTGLHNRRAMMEMLGQVASEIKPGGVGFSVIIADIDHFKKVNDEHGHEVGDRALAAVADCLRKVLGDSVQQHAARWGGEEFLILLPGTRLTAACQQARELRRRVAERNIDGHGLHVTVSLGVAELAPGQSLEDCLRRCDQALYRAKEEGRNTVVAAQGTQFATVT